MKKIYCLLFANYKGFAFSFFVFALCFVLSGNDLSAQSLSNGGFEANTVYPGTGWTGAGNMTAGTIATTGSRTGVNNLTTTFNNNQGYDSWITNSNTVTVTSNNYLHIIAWAKVSASNTNTIIWFSASNTNLVPGATLTTTFAQYSASFKNTGNANSGLQNSSPQPQVGFNTSSSTNRTFNLDDVVAYTDGNSTSDLTAPGAASGFTNGAITSSSVNFTWTNGTDATAPVTNVQGVVVLRTTNTAAALPALNNQGIYSVTGGTSGPNTDQTGNWTIISLGAASNGSAGSYTDNSVVAGTTYKYAVINYDLAYNYSTGLASGNIVVPLATPTITSFSPASGCANTTSVVITGTNLSTATAVTIGGTAATITAATGTTVTVTIGSGTTGTIKVTTPAGTATSAGTFTVNALPVAGISYSGSPYCSSAVTATVTQTGTGSGTYSAPGGLSINSATGAVNLAASTAGTYTVTYSFSNGTCSNTTTASITVTSQPSATISYAGSPYCSNGTTATVTRTGTAGGTYSSTAGLTINSGTGTVTISSSTPGTYTVTYTVAASGGCALYTITTSITITQLPAATISYSGSPYCSSAGTATVTQTGTTGGTYSAAGGLSINSATGAVNLAASTAGTYTVTYTIAAASGCAVVTATASITITSQPAATISYSGTPYCATGTASVTQTGTTGGTYSSTGGLSINSITGAINLAASTAGPYTVTYTVAASGGCALYTTTTSVTVNALPAAAISYAGSPYCSSAGTATVTQTGTSGGTYTALPAGLSINSSTGAINLAASTAGTYTVTYSFSNGTCSNTTTASITVTAQPSATISYAGTPYCSNGTTATVTRTGTAGGTYSSTTGLTINSGTGTVTISSSTPGTYTVTYTVAASGGCALYTITTSITITQLPAATISYFGSPYCSSAGTATVTQTGTTGGTYSAAGGLSINSATGAVNLAASTAGTYTVTYTIAAASGCAVVTATASITITSQPAATISYSGTPYCATGTASVTQTGTTGGTYSSTGGLSINSITGAINLAASTAGPYTVTYTVAASGGCALYTTTTSVTVNALPAAAISYAGSPYCSSAGTATVTQTGTSGGTYTALPAGLSINSSTGAINLAASTAGTYTVTYSFSNGTCSNTTTASITVTAQPSATISYAGTPYCSNGTTAAVTRTGTAGGTYSSTTGLTINSGTGTVTISSSTPGTYTVTYTVAASGGCALYTTTTSITITQLPAATISYSGSPYCSSAGTATVTQTGTTGGTYSAAGGLSINSATGAVNLAASTAGTYTVTYTIAAANGCAVVTATASITVNALPTITSVVATPATICTGSSSNLVVTVPGSGSPTTIVNYDFNSGSSYATLTPTLATNITSSAASSTFTFGTLGGTATDASAFTTNSTAGNGIAWYPDGTLNWTFTLGGSNLNKYTSFKFYFQAESSFNFFGPDPASVSVAYSLNGGAFITTGLSATTLTPGAGSFVSGTFTLPASVNNPTSLSIRITPSSNIFGFETETIDNFQVQALLPSNTYSWTALPSATAGLPGTAGTSLTTNNNITVTPTALTNYTVTATNSNGCQQTATVSVAVTPTVGTPSIPTPSTTTICQASSPTTYTTSATNATSYNWSVTGAGNTISGTGTTATVTWASGFSGTATISVTANGCSGPSAAASTTVTVTPTVGTPSTPTPSTSTICQASAPTTYTTSATNATSYNWTVTGAGNIISGTGTTATVTWASGFTGSATVSVTANGCNGPSASKSTTVSVTPTVGTPTTPTPSASTICQASSPTTYTTSATNATSYNWTVTGAGNIISGTGTTATVTWASGFTGSATVSVTANGCNGPSASKSTTVSVTPTVGTPTTPTPSASTICQASSPTTYTTSATNATSYNWSVTGAGNTISGTGTTATVTWATGFSGFATVSVTANGCNGPSAAASTTVTVTATIGTPTTPTPSATTICQASTPTTYTTSATNATSYNWSVTGAGNTISGTGTTATVTWAAGFTGAAIVSVTANGCNGPSATASAIITVTPAPAATISYSGSPYCSNSGPVAVIQTGTAGGTYSSSAGLSINTSNGTVNIAGSIPGTYTVTYTVAASGGCAIYTASTSITIVANTWIGVTSSDWNDGTNWSCGTLPDATTDVTINSTPHDPVVSTATAMTHNITITGVSVNVMGQKLQIAGTITNNGTFNAGNGTIEMNGSAAQNIPAGTFLNNAVNDFIITNSAGVTLGGAVDVYHSLTYGMNGAILNTGGFLTLKSTMTQTAWIGDMTNHIINGDVTVERYIATGNTGAPNHGKSWQFLGIPTFGSQTIKAAWQEGATMSDLAVGGNIPGSTGNPVAGYGTMLTSNVAGAATQSAPGFDVYTSTGPSIEIYDSLTGNFFSPASTALPVYNPRGYFIFIRGDRSVISAFAAANPTVLRTKGTLFTPANTPPVINVAPNTFESIGNPYASAIDMRNISKTNVDDFFYVWDPRLGSSSGYGGFQTLTKIGTDYYAVPGGTSTYAGYPAASNDFLQSGQAFQVHNSNATSGTVNFAESNKANGSALFTTPNPVNQVLQILSTGLNTVNADGSTGSIVDGILSNFDNAYSNAIDGMDARKSLNTGENLAIRTAGKLLAIERRQPLTPQDTIFLNITGEKAQAYRFHFAAENLDPTLQGVLVDSYTNIRTPLNMAGGTDVSFTVANVNGSNAANRFMIVFEPLKALPVTFTSITAYKQDKNIDVQWRVDNEMNIKQYEVERSANGTDFVKIAVKDPAANNGGSAVYVIADASPLEGYNYYRVKSVDVNGKNSYSTVVKVLIGSLKQDITIYPDPITDGTIHLQLINQPAGNYNIRLLNKLGQEILIKTINHVEGSSTELIKWDFTLAHGIYQLEVTGPANTLTTISVMY